MPAEAPLAILAGAVVGLGIYVAVLAVVGLLSGLRLYGFDNKKIVLPEVQRTEAVGLAIFQTYVIPFEVVSVLLLAALIGAVVLARRD